MEEEKIFTMRSKDDKVFSIKASVAVRSGMKRELIECALATGTIPVENMDEKTLTSVLEFLNFRAGSAISREDKQKFDSKFVKRSTMELIDILQAADDLGSRDLRNCVLHTLIGRAMMILL